MGLFQIPDPVSMFESAKNAGLERDEAKAFISASYSAMISFMWSSGSAKWAIWSGEGQGLKDAATALYLSLEPNIKSGLLSLTVPENLLAADNLARFQSEGKVK